MVGWGSIGCGALLGFLRGCWWFGWGLVDGSGCCGVVVGVKMVAKGGFIYPL